MLTADEVDRIRAIFLQPHTHVSITEAARLLGLTEQQILHAIRDGEVEATETASGESVSREELIAKAQERWSLDAIEDCLADDAARVLPASMRLTDLHVRIPHEHLSMLEQLAAAEHTTVSDIITRQLDALASER